MPTTIFVPRTFGGTLILTVTPLPPLTSGPVATVIADQVVNVAQLTDVARAQATLTDQPRATAVLSEKVV